MKRIILVFVGLMISSAMAFAGGVKVENGWVRAVPPVSKNSAAYFTLHNQSKQDDVLLHLSSGAASHVELHTIVEEPNGAKTMQKVPHATVKAGQGFELKPGGYHVMLIGLTSPLKKGDKVKLELIFQHAGKLVLNLPVRSGGDLMKQAGEHKHHHHCNHKDHH